MTVLIDTHVLLWMASATERIGDKAKELLRNPANRLLFSSASSWEIAIKSAIGRLQLPSPPEVYVPDRMRELGIDGLPVAHAHALRVAALPFHHHDPFDRLLIAQALIEKVPVVTADRKLGEYDVEVIRAD